LPNRLSPSPQPPPRPAPTRHGGIKELLSVQIKISVRHGQLAEDVHEHIRQKADKLNHLFDRLTMIQVTVDLKKEGKSVEFIVQAEHKHDFVAREEHAQVLGAVDMALNNIQMQLRRYKQRIQDHHRDPSAKDVAARPALDSGAES
jgi:putative sigma-54 modulation protein